MSALDFEAVTPSDSLNLSRIARAFSFAVDGAISFETLGGTRVLPSGSLATLVQHSLIFTRINSTGTTATGIKAWY
jgi:hypothetical protein